MINAFIIEDDIIVSKSIKKSIQDNFIRNNVKGSISEINSNFGSILF
jgi:hypothetical protein